MELQLQRLKFNDWFSFKKGQNDVIINDEFGKNSLKHNEGKLFWKQLYSILTYISV